MEKQLLITLVVDEEVQGYVKEIHNIDELTENVNALLDERVIEIRIKKKRDCRSNPVSIIYPTDGLSNIDHHN